MIPTATVRFSAVFASSSILRLASRQTGTVTRKKKAMTSLSLSADETPTAAVSQPPSHEAVFTTLKKSIGNILGKPASRDGMITETKCNSRSEMTASAPRAVECQREEEEEEEEEHEVENKNKKEPKEKDEEESHVTQGVPSYYKPMNMNETLYEGEVAKQLCAMAIAHRFQSPVWATKGSLARFGCTVRDGEEGVSVATMMQTVTLYNLEQTNDCGAAMSSVLRNQEATRWKQWEMPLSASGRPHSQRIRCILREHPSYSQYTSPFWVTEEEAVALGTSVLPWQRGCGILIPRRHNRDASSTASASSSAPEDENEGKSHPMTHNDTTAEDEGEVLMLYNAAQLVDENKVTRETCPPVEFLSAGGIRYNVLLQVYMRRYCQEYNFSMQPFATFITAQRLRWLGGGILATKNDIPPFTCIIKDEIVSLYHADHTTISAEIAKRARDRQRELLDRITGKTCGYMPDITTPFFLTVRGGERVQLREHRDDPHNVSFVTALSTVVFTRRLVNNSLSAPLCVSLILHCDSTRNGGEGKGNCFTIASHQFTPATQAKRKEKEDEEEKEKPKDDDEASAVVVLRSPIVLTSRGPVHALEVRCTETRRGGTAQSNLDDASAYGVTIHGVQRTTLTNAQVDLLCGAGNEKKGK